MGDFARFHTGIAYFASGLRRLPDDYGRRDALARRASAVEATMDRDLRDDRNTLEALDYLEAQSACRVAIIGRFRNALAERQAVKRRQATGDAYKTICKAVGASVETPCPRPGRRPCRPLWRNDGLLARSLLRPVPQRHLHSHQDAG